MAIGLFLGAGFSKWVADLPLVYELFDFNISKIRSKDEIWFNKLKSVKESWDVSYPNSSNELFIKFVIESKNPRINKYLSKYLTRRLSEPFLCNTRGSTQTYMFDDNLINGNPEIERARSFMRKIGLDNIRGIITSNYDLVIEYALSSNKFNYGVRNQIVLGRGHNPMFPWQNTPVRLSGDIQIAKIHGSLSFDGTNYWSSGICGLRGNAMIVPPYPEKKADHLLNAEWKIASEVLYSIDKLVIFGFNFNEYDLAILELLKTNSSQLKEVDIYDVESKIDKASKIWDKTIVKEINVNHIIV